MLFIFALLSIIAIQILYFFLGLQVISLGDYVRSGFEKEFRIITDIERYGEYPDFLYLVIALSAITIGSFLWKAIFSYDSRTRYKTRLKTLEERKMALGKLGFGLMRLPQNSADGTDIDIEQVKQMVDLFLENGFTYFDTSYVYHNGESERAIAKALVDRHPRESYTLASKFPTFNMPEKDEVESIFNEQLEKCHVEYFDYYLLHNLNRIIYRSEVERIGLFGFTKKWKEEGKIRHIGFSYHDDAETFDMILNEHPEVEFVQIVVNYYDWDEPFIRG